MCLAPGVEGPDLRGTELDGQLVGLGLLRSLQNHVAQTRHRGPELADDIIVLRLKKGVHRV